MEKSILAKLAFSALAVTAIIGVGEIASSEAEEDKGFEGARVAPADSPHETKSTKKFDGKAVAVTGCGVEEDSAPKTRQDAHIRRSTQRGLDFLVKSTTAWQEQHECFGCHVQGVTGEALSVGHHNQYQIEPGGMETVFEGVLDLKGSLRSDSGHARDGGNLRLSSRAFGGAALARYDQWVSSVYSDDLLTAAQDLVELQADDGSMKGAYQTGVVAQGDIQGTYQAIQTWQQAYARSADDRWLTSVQKAEAHLQQQIDAWHQTPTQNIQQVNYALLGLLEAGVGSSEKVMTDLQEKLLKAQNDDGGWGYTLGKSATNPSATLATGQTLYALRMMGMNDSDDAIERGIDFLIERQQGDGGWSDRGSEKAEAMWAVLGLVATDVLSVNVAGLKNGQRVDNSETITISAVDNSGSNVKKVELFLDDVPLHGECGDETSYTWDASDLDDGRHILDAVATNSRGEESRRRFILYAGETFVVDTGTRFQRNGTVISARDIAPETMEHDVELEILSTREEDGVPVADETVFTTKKTGAQGALSFRWNGKSDDGETLDRGDYVARLLVRDSDGKVRQKKELQFVHDTIQHQRANYAQIQGDLQLEDDKNAANAQLELVDEKGRVVKRTRSTASGKYRFRNVKSGKKYKVRVKRKGFKPAEAEVDAQEAEESDADLELFWK